MFDFIGYTRDAEIDITIQHPAKGIYTSLDVRDKHSGFYEHYDITDKEAASCGNIYTHIGIVLDKMVARIGAKPQSNTLTGISVTSYGNAKIFSGASNL